MYRNERLRVSVQQCHTRADDSRPHGKSASNANTWTRKSDLSIVNRNNALKDGKPAIKEGDEIVRSIPKGDILPQRVQ